jgi:AraC-like DNA-binding protein
MLTASIQNVRVVLAASVARGLPLSPLYAAVELEPHQLLDPDGRVPADLALRLWQVAAEASGDPAFGLLAAEHVTISSHGPLGYAMHSSATLGEALRKLAAFFRLVNQYTSLTLVEERGAVRARFVTSYPGDPDLLRHPTECLFAGLVRGSSRILGEPVGGLSVTFRHTAPAADAPHREVFGVAPTFGAPHSELVFPRRLLDRPSQAPDPDLLAEAERHLRRRLEELPREDTFSARVRAALVEELRRGEPTLGRMASRLRVSQRTLQRRLGGEGTSLQALVDQLRRDASIRHLSESRESIAEVAFLLGFAEVSAFHRAFKRWTGKTPGAYRRARRPGGGLQAS